jgi:hypothetical protein
MDPIEIAALIAAVPPTAAVIIGFMHTRKKIQEVHVLVNDRLDAALAEIKNLKAQRDA